MACVLDSLPYAALLAATGKNNFTFSKPGDMGATAFNLKRIAE